MANGLPLTQYTDEQLQDVVDKSQTVDNMMTFDEDGELYIGDSPNEVNVAALMQIPSVLKFINTVHELVTIISDPA